MEKLDLYSTEIEYSKILELKSMSVLKLLNWCPLNRPGCSESYNLKFQFPNLCINEHQMCVKIASPCQKFESSQGLWEIETKQLKLFRKNYWRWGTIGKASWFFGRNSDWIWNWHPGIPQEFRTELQQNSDQNQPTLPNEAKTFRNTLLFYQIEPLKNGASPILPIN